MSFNATVAGPSAYDTLYAGVDYSSLNWAEQKWVAWYVYWANPVIATGLLSFLMHEVCVYSVLVLNSILTLARLSTLAALSPGSSLMRFLTLENGNCNLPRFLLLKSNGNVPSRSCSLTLPSNFPLLVSHILISLSCSDAFLSDLVVPSYGRSSRNEDLPCSLPYMANHGLADFLLHVLWRPFPLCWYVDLTHPNKFFALTLVITSSPCSSPAFALQAHPQNSPQVLCTFRSCGWIRAPCWSYDPWIWYSWWLPHLVSLHRGPLHHVLLMGYHQALPSYRCSQWLRYVFVQFTLNSVFDPFLDFPWSLQHILPFWSGAEHHDFHHMAFTNNYSTSFRWWDRIFGTDDKYLVYREKVKAAKAKSANQKDFQLAEQQLMDEVLAEGLKSEQELEARLKKAKAQ